LKLQFRKRSEWKFVSRTILHKQVYNTPQLIAESVSKACVGVHTRDFKIEIACSTNLTISKSNMKKTYSRLLEIVAHIRNVE
jgi:hypothetical protein